MKLVGVVGVQSRKFERQALLRVLQDPKNIPSTGEVPTPNPRPGIGNLESHHAKQLRQHSLCLFTTYSRYLDWDTVG
jgi:hypothetical protein